MPPKVALILCILFIFVVLKIDFKEKADLFSGLWIPLIWILISGSRPVSYWLNPEPTLATEIDYTSGNLVNRTVLLILIGCGLFILSKRKIEWLQILKSHSWIFILFLYMGLSILWSDFQGVSFKRWIRAIGDLVMVLVVLSEHAPIEAIKRLFRRFSYIIIPLSILCIKYFRDIGVAYTADGLHQMWVGITVHKNTLGTVSCVCACFFLWNIWKTWGKKKVFIDIIFLLMALWLLAGSKSARSATAIVIFFIGIFIFIGLNLFKSNPRYLMRFVILFALVFLLFLPVLYDSLLPSILEATGRNMTFTGRTLIWHELIDIGSHHPILGRGYGSFWIGNLTHNLWDKFKPIGQAHNGYIDVWLQLGWVGVFLLIVVIFSTYKNIMRTFLFDFEYGQLRMTFLTMILIHNITEASFLKGTNFFWFIFLLFAVTIPPKYQINNFKKMDQSESLKRICV